MLKKLAKYGNSNALILDRAILDLLNINEGAILKLQTDGKSLIITPHKNKQNTEVFATGLEMTNQIIQEIVEKKTASLKTNPITNQLLTDWAPGTDNFAKMQQAYKTIMLKYEKDLPLLQTKSYNQELEILTNKYQNDKQSPGFIEEFLALRLKHAPNLVNMDKEMQEANIALGYPDFSTL